MHSMLRLLIFMLYLGAVGGNLAGLVISCSHADDVNGFAWVLKDVFKTRLELEMEWKAEVRDGGGKSSSGGGRKGQEEERG